MQRKMYQKRRLEIALSKLRPHPSPKAYLEQYTIPPNLAAEILYLAAYTYEDIVGKTVSDLGCGTGSLGIGAAILGAKEVIGVDLDVAAVKEAQHNASMLRVHKVTSWIVADIDVLRGTFDTVVQNPPFGVQRRTADRRFLQKALEVGEVVYSLHKSGMPNREFIKSLVRKCEGNVDGIFQMKLVIPPTFNFHRKRKYQVNVDLYRIVKRK